MLGSTDVDPPQSSSHFLASLYRADCGFPGLCPSLAPPPHVPSTLTYSHRKGRVSPPVDGWAVRVRRTRTMTGITPGILGTSVALWPSVDLSRDRRILC